MDIKDDKEYMINNFDFSSFAGGKNGNLQIQKYLYETGLQNIFNEYEKNIASLDANKQKEIQDAYYLRELSKKYLGEYASNQDIGDVSGNLIDLYGQYQSNLSEINQNYDNLKLGFENAYREKQNEYTLGLASTQMQMEMEERLEKEKIMQEENMGRILNVLATGNFPDGMDAKTFIESEKNNMPLAQYWALKTETDVAFKQENLNVLANSVNNYNTKEEWDKYIDEMLQKGTINVKDAQELKEFYETQRHTTFDLVKESNLDYSYFTEGDVKPGGKVFESKSKEIILAETNKIFDSTSDFYKTLEEEANEKQATFGTPFSSSGKWFIKETMDGEVVYIELENIQDPNKVVNSFSITKDTPQYDEIHNILKGKNGSIETDYGMQAFEYDEETGEYKPYINFQAFNVGGEKGDFIINGVKYHIEKKYKNNGRGGIVDIKNNIKDGQLTKIPNSFPEANKVVDLFREKYFNGDKNSFEEYVKSSRGWLGGNKVSTKNDNKKVQPMVVLYDGAYFTINDGELWELKKTNQ